MTINWVELSKFKMMLVGFARALVLARVCYFIVCDRFGNKKLDNNLRAKVLLQSEINVSLVIYTLEQFCGL